MNAAVAGSGRAAPTRSLGSIRRSFEPWNDPAQCPLIEFDRVTKRFGDTEAVSDLSLAVFEREFFALLGPSGCGKSTLLRMLAGFEQPTTGDIRLAGTSLAGVPPHRRPVNMMFQSYALFPHMSVATNIAFGLKQDRLPRAEIEARVAEMLRLVKMERFATRKPQQLSGGQQQRVALARSLAKRPKVLLLDEPLGALDKKLREETQFELMDLQQDLGLTFVVVTHDQEEAMTMADRIAVMREGRLAQVATPAILYEAPDNRYVADFIGTVSILDAVVEETEGGTATLRAEGRRIRVETDRSLAPGETVGFAIRPEKIRLSRQPPEGSALNAVEGTVWDIAYLGDVTLFNVKLDSGTMMRATVINAARSAPEQLTWEERVTLSFAPDAGLVLKDEPRG